MQEARRYADHVFGLVRPYLGTRVLEVGSGIGTMSSRLVEVAEMVVNAFSNRRMSLHEVAETDDGRVVESWRMEGKHVGDAMGIPASNQDISVRGMEIWRVDNGKIVEHWGVVDIGDVLEKAGLIPPS